MQDSRIIFKTGNILAEDVEALVNTVNCVGAMGRGIALQFKKAYKDNFDAYASACKRDEVRPGKMFVYETHRLTNPRYIINFPTKRHWRGKSRMEDIECGLTALAEVIRSRNIKSIAIPPLACGLGGLDWADVRPRIEQMLLEFDDIEAVVFEPGGAPAEERFSRSREAPKMTAGRAALVGLMHRYLAGLLDPFVTLLEVHKLMYFMQATGEPLRLAYTKAPHGPYAENLRHVLHAVEGHMVAGYADGGDAPDKQLELVPGALEEAQAFLANCSATQHHFERVSDLVEGFESPFGMELLSTVHWIVDREQVHLLDDVVDRVHAWGKQKQQFTRRQIELAQAVLAEKGWFGGSIQATDAWPPTPPNAALKP